MDATPGQIVQQLIRDLGLGSAVKTDDWFVANGAEPPTPDRVVTVFHYAGRKQGRDQRSGQSYVNPSMQVRVRGLVGTEAEQRAQAICDAFEGPLTTRRLVTIVLRVGNQLEVHRFLIHNFSLTSPVMFLAQQEDKARQIYVFSGNLTVTQES